MADLSTNYLGLKLKNPVIAGASNLMKDLDKVKAIEAAGASAVVYKSLFEEQINQESAELEEDLQEFDHLHAEMITQHPNIEHAGPKEHLLNLEKVKKSVNIPVIASLNAIYKETWKEYAEYIKDTGVDALELNLYSVPRKFDQDGESFVKKQLEAIQAVKSAVNIPVSVKLSPFYSNTLNVIRQMDEAGVKGFVLFNKFFEPEINIENEEHEFPFNLSVKGDYRLALRYAGLLYENIKGDVCANSGIFDGEDVIKLVLAGADVVQVVSTLYRNKISQITKMLEEIEGWMKQKGYGSLDDFKGKLARKNSKDPFVYRRAQYVDILLNPQQVTKKYTV